MTMSSHGRTEAGFPADAEDMPKQPKRLAPGHLLLRSGLCTGVGAGEAVRGYAPGRLLPAPGNTGRNEPPCVRAGRAPPPALSRRRARLPLPLVVGIAGASTRLVLFRILQQQRFDCAAQNGLAAVDGATRGGWAKRNGRQNEGYDGTIPSLMKSVMAKARAARQSAHP